MDGQTGLSNAMLSVVDTCGTVNPSSPLVFAGSSSMQVHTSLFAPSLFSWEFTAKPHSHGHTRNCSPVCHFKVTYVPRKIHGHSEIMVSISASILDKNIFTLQVVLRLSCRGLLVGALCHSAFQSVVTEARLRRNQVQAHGHKAFVLGTPETP